MFAAERINKIKEILIEYNKADVSNLSKLLSVSEVTIRKYLEQLEEEGFITRTHGGAVLNENVSLESSYVCEIPELQHKKMIGLIAAQMVEEREAIFIGSGTTCLQIAKSLKGKSNITVVTYNITAAAELASSQGIKVILTGGILRNDKYTTSVIGDDTIKAIKNIYVDKAFIGVSGVSFKRGYTMYDSLDAVIASEVSKVTENLVVVADNTKFDKIAFSRLGNLEMANRVISDELVPQEYLKYYFENDIQMFTAYKLD